MRFPSIVFDLFGPTDAGAGGGADDSNEVADDLATISDEGGDDGADDDSSADEDNQAGEDEGRTTVRRARSTASSDQEGEEGDDDDEDSDDEDSETDDELDDEIEPIGDEEDKEQPVYARPPMKEIKSKYPNFFKDFPQLKASFFEYPKFTELFSDVESAREAASKAQEYDNLETTLVGNGDPKLLLSAIAENNPKALKKLVGNFGDALRGVDQDAYVQLTTPIIEELLFHASAHGVKIGNKNLQLAARHIANFVFANGGEIPDITKKADKSRPSEAEVQLQEERQVYAKEKFTSALSDVVELIKPDMNAILNNKMEGLTGFERRQIVKEAKAEIDRILTGDKAFQGTLRTLWKKAETAGYSNESKSRIKRAWLDRAKLIAPGVRNRLRQEALNSRNGSKRKGAPDDKEGDESKVKFKVTSEKKTFPSGGGKTPSGSPKRRVLDPKQIDWRKTSDRDILDMK